MPQARVWNDNTLPFNDTYQGEKIYIPPKGFIMMESGSAHDFKGQFYPRKLDAGGTQLPESYKMIRVEDNPKMETVVTHKCQKCAQTFETAKALDVHSDEHIDDMIDEEEVKKRRGRKAKADTGAEKAQG